MALVHARGSRRADTGRPPRQATGRGCVALIFCILRYVRAHIKNGIRDRVYVSLIILALPPCISHASLRANPPRRCQAAQGIHPIGDRRVFDTTVREKTNPEARYLEPRTATQACAPARAFRGGLRRDARRIQEKGETSPSERKACITSAKARACSTDYCRRGHDVSRGTLLE